MKKFFLALALFATLISVDSCSKKKGCTNPTAPNYDSSAEEDNGSCLDWTASIVGTYTGVLADSTVGAAEVISNETVVVSKVDNSHIRISSSNANVIPFNATIGVQNSAGTTFTIPTFTVGTETFIGVNQTTNGVTAAGAIQGNDLLYLIQTVDGQNFEGFRGTKQ